mgnify:CR=1 FL=1
MAGAGGCKVYEVEVPDAHEQAHEVAQGYSLTVRDLFAEVEMRIGYLEVRKVEGLLGEGERRLLEKAKRLAAQGVVGYVKAYCLLYGYRTALLVEDENDSEWWVAFFGLGKGDAEEAARRARALLASGRAEA